MPGLHNLGHTLIDRGFSKQYGEEISINKWPAFINSFEPNKKNIKDKSGQELLTFLEANTEEDCRDVIITLLLHVILKPVRRLQVKTQEGKSYWKSGIKASQDSFFIIVTNPADVFRTTEERATFYKNLDLSCQTYMIGVGNSICKYD